MQLRFLTNEEVEALYDKYMSIQGEAFTKAIMRRVAMGMDIAAHNLTGDMSDSTYSSSRVAELSERDMWVTRQSWFIQAFVEPVYQEWFRRAITAGVLLMPNGSALPVAKADKFIAHEWQGRRWAWVDPTKDINAARLAIQTGVASPQMVAAQNGVDIEDALDSIAAFEKMAKAKGVTLLDYGSGPINAPEADAQAEAQTQAARTAFTNLVTAQPPNQTHKALEQIKTPAAVQHLVGLLTAYDWQFINQAQEIRGYAMAQLLEETKNPSASIRLKALALLGKVTEVGLFTEKIEVKKSEMTDAELEARIKEKLGKMAKIVDITDIREVQEIDCQPVDTNEDASESHTES
jgi:hypothetical protein